MRIRKRRRYGKRLDKSISTRLNALGDLAYQALPIDHKMNSIRSISFVFGTSISV